MMVSGNIINHNNVERIIWESIDRGKPAGELGMGALRTPVDVDVVLGVCGAVGTRHCMWDEACDDTCGMWS